MEKNSWTDLWDDSIKTVRSMFSDMLMFRKRVYNSTNWANPFSCDPFGKWGYSDSNWIP